MKKRITIAANFSAQLYRICGLLLFLMFAEITSAAPITFDNNGQGTATASQPSISLPGFTVPAGNDRALLIFVTIGGTPANLTSVKFGSTDATLVSSDVNASRTVQAYYVLLGSGPSVTADVTSTRNSNSVPYHLAAGSFQNVNQFDPIGNTASAVGTGPGPSVLTVESHPANTIVDYFYHLFTGAPTQDASQTILAHVNAGHDSKASFKTATGNSTTMSFTGNNGRPYVHLAFAMKQSGVAVPTMGEWGLIILALLVLCFATVFMMRRQTSIAGAANVSMSQSSGIPFERASFGKMLAVVMLGLVAVFTIAIFAFGYEMTNADVPGVLIAGPIGAYLLHLLFGAKK